MALLINQETQMTSFNNHLLSIFGMISGILIMLLSPHWLNYMIMTALLFTAFVYIYQTYPEKLKLAVEFFTEFFGFCLMLALFLICFIGMGIVFA